MDTSVIVYRDSRSDLMPRKKWTRLAAKKIETKGMPERSRAQIARFFNKSRFNGKRSNDLRSQQTE